MALPGGFFLNIYKYVDLDDSIALLSFKHPGTQTRTWGSVKPNHLKFFSIRPPFVFRIHSDLCLFFITVSIISLMMMIGTLLGGFVTEQFGCLQCLRISLLLEMAGWASIFWAKNFTELMVGRVLTGISSCSKAHIFWEGHKILRNLHLTCVLCRASQK